MKLLFSILRFFIFFVIFTIGSNSSVFADTVNVNLEVSPCNLNSICESVIGETSYNCPIDCGAPPADLGSGGGSTTVLPSITFSDNKLNNLTLTPEVTSSILKWTTDFPSILTIKWGKTADYEAGSIGEAWYHSYFDIRLENLESNTLYYFSIELTDTLGRKIIRSGTFRTLSIIDTSRPNPASELNSFLSDEKILLNWRFTNNLNTSVRLVRSDIFYPLGPTNGKVVYEGSGSRVDDYDIAEDRVYYYSLFVRSENGLYSYPTITAVYYPKKTIQPVTSIVPIESSATDADFSIGTTSRLTGDYEFPDGTYDPLLRNDDPYVLPDFDLTVYKKTLCNNPSAYFNKNFFILGPEDLIFVQNQNRIRVENPNIAVSPNKTIYLQLKTTKIQQEKIRSMAICINGNIPEIKKSYLFNYNKTKDVFEVQIPTFYTSNDYEFYIGMLKYNSDEIVLMSGEFTFDDKAKTKPDSRVKRLINSIISFIKPFYLVSKVPIMSLQETIKSIFTFILGR